MLSLFLENCSKVIFEFFKFLKVMKISDFFFEMKLAVKLVSC